MEERKKIIIDTDPGIGTELINLIQVFFFALLDSLSS